MIDFNTTPSNNAQKSLEDEEFDMFAQSRSSTFADSRQFGSTYEDNINDAATEQTIAGALAAKGLYQPIQSTVLISQPQIDPFAFSVAAQPCVSIVFYSTFNYIQLLFYYFYSSEKVSQ